MMARRAGRPRADPSGAARHIPVLLSEVLEALAPHDGEPSSTAPFGAGGYTRAILKPR